MDNGGDILQLCRLCLVKDDVNIPIFEGQGDIRQIFLKISSCLPVKVSREDKLPKKICDGCSYKLDMLYEFWNTTANAEKQLLSWLGEAGMNSKMTDGTISAVAQQIKPVETFVKQEAIDPVDIHGDDNDDDKSYMFQQKFTVEEAGPSATVTSNDEEPPPKRARRTAAVKAQIAMDPESDDDDDSGEPMTKVEDESDDSDGDDQEPNYVDVPSTSADDQPGPSGVGKDGVEAPSQPQPQPATDYTELLKKFNVKESVVVLRDITRDSSIKIHNNTAKLPHNDVEDFGCTTCGRVFTTARGLKLHKNTCDREAFVPNKSNKPKLKAATGKNTIKNYFKKLPAPQVPSVVHKCEPCKATFASLDEVKKHPANEKCMFLCGICFKSYNTIMAFTVHMLQHKISVFKPIRTPEKLHQCPLCSESFDDYIKLKLHTLKHQKETNNSQDDETEIICELCFDVFDSKEELDDHMEFHNELNHESKANTTHDPEETETVPPKEALTEMDPIPVIESSYSLADNIRENGSGAGYQILQPNQSVPKEHYECKTCERMYISVEEYEKHLPSRCKLEKVCPVCFIIVEGNSKWYKHVTEKHGRWSTCRFCFKTFAELSQLNVHKLAHLNGIEKICNICQKSFQTYKEFNDHLHVAHLSV